MTLLSSHFILYVLFLGLSLHLVEIGSFSLFPRRSLPARDALAVYAKRRKGLDNELRRSEDIAVDVDDEKRAANNDNGIDEATRVKLKAEIASPFRKLRQYFYLAMGGAGGLGIVTTVPELILSLQDSSPESSAKVQESIINIAIDLGGVVGGIFLWDRESAAEKNKLERFGAKERKLSSALSDEEVIAREEFLAKLPVEIVFSEKNETDTRIVSVGDLQLKGGQNVIIIAGKSAFVKDAMMAARLQGSSLFVEKNTVVIPVTFSSGEEIEAGKDSSKGFGMKSLETTYVGKPTQVNVWLKYLEGEMDLAEKQGAKEVLSQGLVLAVKKDGKVLRRGLGLPPWTRLCEDLNAK